MKQLVRQSSTKYQWWNNSGMGNIDPQHVGRLEECAREHIRTMLGKGYTAGELNYRIDDNSNQVDYRGWWKGT